MRFIRTLQSESRTWAWLLLLFAVIPSGRSFAQIAPDFDQLAANADAARNANNIPEAITLYTQALRLNPTWQDGWWYLGSLQYGSGAYTLASESFSHFLELKPDSGAALALRGLCEFETHDYSQSLKDIQNGLALGAANNPRNEQIIRYHEAMLLTRLGKFQDALHSYLFFAKNKQSDPELLVAIGLAGLHMPLLPDETSAEQQPLLTAAGDAAFKFMEGDEKAAQQAFEGVFQHFPEARNAHYMYGFFLYAYDSDAALSEFKKELEVAPDNTDALTMIAWQLLMRNQPKEALPYARRVAEAKPQQGTAQLVLGRAIMGSGNVRGGLEYLERALKLDPNNVEVHIALAKAYSELGRNQDARRERMLCLQMTRKDAATIEHP